MKTRRSGFTLVELLTVIIIIAMLAGMITGAVMSAVASVNQSVIRQEISQLELALNAYKAEFGEYPPDGTNSTEVTNHIKRCYKNATSTTVYTTVTPENALVIFLGPHNANPKTPFTSTTTNLTKGFFEFDKNRIDTSNYSYTPRGCAVPYVYFKAKVTGGVGTYENKSRSLTVSSTTYSVPCYYYTDNSGNSIWYNDKTFQIISAGLDNVYSASTTAKQVTSDSVNNGIGTDDLDNIVNFSTKRIKDLLD
ncbi:MAG: type II secretion system protein [Planctomycetia bacterium]|nr:type II secretion system protein [Planctomycetia bacterium]